MTPATQPPGSRRAAVGARTDVPFGGMPVALRALAAACLVSLPGGLAAQQMPMTDVVTARAGALPDAQVVFDHVEAVCIDADGDDAATPAKLERRGFNEVEDSPAGRFAPPDYRLAMDLRLGGGELSPCSMRALTPDRVSAIETPIAPPGLSAAPSPAITISSVETHDPNTGFRRTTDPAQMNSDALKVITIIWVAPS